MSLPVATPNSGADLHLLQSQTRKWLVSVLSESAVCLSCPAARAKLQCYILEAGEKGEEVSADAGAPVAGKEEDLADILSDGEILLDVARSLSEFIVEGKEWERSAKRFLRDASASVNGHSIPHADTPPAMSDTQVSSHSDPEDAPLGDYPERDDVSDDELSNSVARARRVSSDFLTNGVKPATNGQVNGKVNGHSPVFPLDVFTGQGFDALLTPPRQDVTVTAPASTPVKRSAALLSGVGGNSILTRGFWKSTSRVDQFLKFCRFVGLMDVHCFTAMDLVQRKDMRRVYLCVRALSKKCANMNVPDFDAQDIPKWARPDRKFHVYELKFPYSLRKDKYLSEVNISSDLFMIRDLDDLFEAEERADSNITDGCAAQERRRRDSLEMKSQEPDQAVPMIFTEGGAVDATAARAELNVFAPLGDRDSSEHLSVAARDAADVERQRLLSVNVNAIESGEKVSELTPSGKERQNLSRSHLERIKSREMGDGILSELDERARETERGEEGGVLQRLQTEDLSGNSGAQVVPWSLIAFGAAAMLMGGSVFLNNRTEKRDGEFVGREVKRAGEVERRRAMEREGVLPTGDMDYGMRPESPIVNQKPMRFHFGSVRDDVAGGDAEREEKGSRAPYKPESVGNARPGNDVCSSKEKDCPSVERGHVHQMRRRYEKFVSSPSSFSLPDSGSQSEGRITREEILYGRKGGKYEGDSGFQRSVSSATPERILPSQRNSSPLRRNPLSSAVDRLIQIKDNIQSDYRPSLPHIPVPPFMIEFLEKLQNHSPVRNQQGGKSSDASLLTSPPSPVPLPLLPPVIARMIAAMQQHGQSQDATLSLQNATKASSIARGAGPYLPERPLKRSGQETELPGSIGRGYEVYADEGEEIPVYCEVNRESGRMRERQGQNQPNRAETTPPVVYPTNRFDF